MNSVSHKCGCGHIWNLPVIDGKVSLGKPHRIKTFKMVDIGNMRVEVPSYRISTQCYCSKPLPRLERACNNLYNQNLVFFKGLMKKDKVTANA